MNNIVDNICYDSADYVEMVTESRPVEDVTLEDLEEMELELWNYPLTEIDHIIENDLKVVLVRFPELYGGYEYRFCEIQSDEEE